MQNNESNVTYPMFIKELGMEYATKTSKRKFRFALYKCSCGTEFKAQINSVKSGNAKSCGCLRGANHSLSNHKLYSVWRDMISRTSNEKNSSYKYYGEIGISVCDEWKDVSRFINDMESSYIAGLSLDRINNDLGYCKENCRWTTCSIQAQNTRLLAINNTSGYRGVSYCSDRDKWAAAISVNNIVHKLGRFSTAIEAAKAYDDYVIKHNLEHTINRV